jgi:hypothetical protein
MTTIHHCLAASLVLAAASAAHANFQYTSFASTSGLTLVGSAQQSAGKILVTPSMAATAGAVWTAQKQSVAAGFDTTLTFHVEGKNGNGSDGIALVIQNASATALGAGGAGMGYARNDTFNLAGIANSFAMEIDTFNNGAYFTEAPGANHIALQSRGLLENVPDTRATLGSVATTDLSDGPIHTVRLRYLNGFMDVFLDGLATPVLHTAVNLSALLSLDNSTSNPGMAWIGVTSSTGGPADREAHVLDAWSFSNTIPTPGASSLLALAGIAALRRTRR